MTDILIKNTTIVTVNPARETLYNAAIAITGDRITDIGDTAVLEKRHADAKKIIDGSRKAVFPGLINTHNHLFQTNYKGLGDDKVLKDWLTDMTYPSSIALTPEDCYTGALIGCIEGIHSGVTTQLDYMYPHPCDGLDDAVIRAFRDLGIRAIFGRGYMDAGECFGVCKEIMQSPAKVEGDIRRLVREYEGADNGRIRICLAPAAPWCISKEAYEMTKMLYDEGMNLTIHTAETPFDREATQQLYGMLDTDILVHYDMLSERTLLVHCVQLNDRDIRMIKAHNAKISHNPNSNLYLASGIAPIPKLNLAGVDVSLGVDGAASNNTNDMIETLKTAALIQKGYHRDPTVMTAEKVVEMATIEGARCIGMDKEIGSLEIGKKADLFIFNPERCMKAVPMHNPVSTLVYSSDMANVETTIADGRILMENGVLTTMDEAETARRCSDQADSLARRANTTHLKKRPWRSIAY